MQIPELDCSWFSKFWITNIEEMIGSSKQGKTTKKPLFMPDSHLNTSLSNEIREEKRNEDHLRIYQTGNDETIKAIKHYSSRFLNYSQLYVSPPS